jgi:hypothetical protein
MSGKHFGKCALCGKEMELTFEHIPPRCALNYLPSKPITGKEAFSFLINSKNGAKGLQYENQQSGMGAYTLCANCNSKTGSWYGDEYIEFANGIHFVMMQEKPTPNTVLEIGTPELHLLRFFKQVISMFCSVNSGMNIQDLRDFVLDRERNSFNKNKYQLFMYLLCDGIRKSSRIAIKGISNPNTHHFEYVTLSEIATYPLGFILYIDMPVGYKAKSVNITDLCDIPYNEKCKCHMTIPVYECHTLFPEDFRSKQDIERCRE